jgi:hypothetical protein
VTLARAIVFGLAVVGVLTAPHEARAEVNQEVKWQPGWRRFTLLEGAIAGGMIATSGVLFFVGQDDEPHWRGGVLFDDAARRSLRLGSDQERQDAAAVSDILATGMAVKTLIVDPLIITALANQAPDLGGQMALMNLQAYAASTFLWTITRRATARERPSQRECGDGQDPSFPACNGADANASFFSGHATFAFTSAGLACAHHVQFPLYGDGWPDGLACATGITFASATAASRVLADRHYMSDVLTGALIGFASGFGLPTLLHYRGFSGGRLPETAHRRRATTTTLQVVPFGVGVGVVGSF